MHKMNEMLLKLIQRDTYSCLRSLKLKDQMNIFMKLFLQENRIASFTTRCRTDTKANIKMSEPEEATD